jgi:RHS repeat-associated protein
VISRLTPGVSFQSVTGIYVRGTSVRVGMIRFADCLTVEHNVLGPGEIAHILRNRTVGTTGGYASSDTWFAYNQVGSVMGHSGSAGTLTQAIEQDAWGNTLASATSGAWAAAQSGWHHGTKQRDQAAGADYSWMRWYSFSTGAFFSKSPMPRMIESPYSFVESRPIAMVDPTGLQPAIGQYAEGYEEHVSPAERSIITRELLKNAVPSSEQPRVNLNSALAIAYFNCYRRGQAATNNYTDPQANAMRHCAWQCCLTQVGGYLVAYEIGQAHERSRPGGPLDNAADNTNNAVGRALGLDRNANCETACRNALQKGKLRRNDEDGEVCPETNVNR